jgi:ABC-type phosphate transport system substrate-binding protein
MYKIFDIIGGTMKKPILLFIILLCISNGFSQIVLIANKGVELSVTSVSAVTDIYTLESQKSTNGKKLLLFDLKTDPGDKFYSAIGKSSTELKKIWMKKQLSGDGKAPLALDSEDEMLSKIASTPEAIGYISKEKVTNAVKVLFELK